MGELKQQPRSFGGAYLGKNRYLAVTAYGHKIFLDTRDISLAPHIIVGGLWETWITQRILESLREGYQVVEIGCNVGWYTLLIAQQIGTSGKLIGFEANPSLVQLATDSLSVNGYLDRVCLHEIAVSDCNGESYFNVRERYQGGSGFREPSQDELQNYKDKNQQITVKTVALDDFLVGKDRQVNFMKIDAEGAEPKIFNGMINILKENTDIEIVMEYDASHSKPTVEMMRSFYDLGFRTYRIEYTGKLTEFYSSNIQVINQLCDIFLSRKEVSPADLSN